MLLYVSYIFTLTVLKNRNFETDSLPHLSNDYFGRGFFFFFSVCFLGICVSRFVFRFFPPIGCSIGSVSHIAKLFS